MTYKMTTKDYVLGAIEEYAEQRSYYYSTPSDENAEEVQKAYEYLLTMLDKLEKE